VANRKDPDLATRGYEAIEREVATAAERDHQLVQPTLDDPADRWMTLEHLDRTADRISRGDRRVGESASSGVNARSRFAGALRE
jgi:hypothetical protein